MSKAQQAIKFTGAELDELAPKKSQADKLIELAESVSLFHADVDEPFASVRRKTIADSQRELTRCREMLLQLREQVALSRRVIAEGQESLALVNRMMLQLATKREDNH